MKKIAKKPDEVTRLRRRCKLLGEGIREEARAGDQSKRDLRFMDAEYAKLKAKSDDQLFKETTLTAKLDEAVKALAESKKAAKEAQGKVDHEKYLREYSDRNDKAARENAKEWMAYATQLGLQLHAIESIVSGVSLASMPEAVAVRLLVEGAKKKPCPKDLETSVPWDAWKAILGGSAMLLAMMGMYRIGKSAAGAADAPPVCPDGSKWVAGEATAGACYVKKGTP